MDQAKAGDTFGQVWMNYGLGRELLRTRLNLENEIGSNEIKIKI
jgi:hypothetical protein